MTDKTELEFNALFSDDEKFKHLFTKEELETFALEKSKSVPFKKSSGRWDPFGLECMAILLNKIPGTEAQRKQLRLAPLISKPSWLAALNTPKIENAEDPAPTPDEHVERLPAYEAPPPLVIKDYSIPDTKNKPVTINESLAHPEPAANTILPFKFDAEAFDRKVHEAQTPDNVVIKEPRKSNKGSDPYNITVQAGELNSVLSKAMPFFPSEESLLPQPKIGYVPTEEAKPWLNRLAVSEQVAFDNHIKNVMSVNPLHAAKLMRLKGFESKYVGVIRTPEMAENHLVICLNKAEDPGGWSDSNHQQTVKAQGMLESALQKESNAAQRARWQRYIFECREAWKDAIVYRTNQMEILNEQVKAAHATYKEAKELSFNEYVAMIESGE